MIRRGRIVPAITNARIRGDRMTVDETRPEAGSGSPLKKIALGAVPIVVGVLLLFGLPFLRDSTTGIGAAAVGACAQETDPTKPGTLKVLDCADPAANLVVLAQVDGTKDCFTIDGTVSQTSIDLPDKRTCLGIKGADPYRSTNTAAAGECLTEDGQERTRCTAADAVHRILQRFDKVPTAGKETACDAVPGTEMSTSFNITETTTVETFGSGSKAEPVHVVFCLAPAKS
jgi:hypothetical protein